MYAIAYHAVKNDDTPHKKFFFFTMKNVAPWIAYLVTPNSRACASSDDVTQGPTCKT